MHPPSRQAFGIRELIALAKCGLYYYINKIDPLYQSRYEQLFCCEFSSFMGQGYTDAVNSGTSAAYIAIKALQLKQGSTIAISGICDPGVYNAIILAGCKPLPVPLDYESNHPTYSITSFHNLQKSREISALIHVYAFGSNSGALGLQEIRRTYPDLSIIEDISQAIGATFKNIPLGNFSDIAISSTMGRKALISGASGGLLFTKRKSLYHQILSFADRGKAVSADGRVIKDAPSNTNISLNFAADEFGCAIARASLKRLPNTQSKRLRNLNYIADHLLALHPEGACSIMRFEEGSCPFVGIIKLREGLLLRKKERFIEKLVAHDVPINQMFNQISFMWPWLQKHVEIDSRTFEYHRQMSTQWSNKNIVLYLHEGYTKQYCQRIASGISSAIHSLLNE